MRRIARLSLFFFLTGSLASAAPLPQLFHKAKEQFRLNAFANALATLSEVERESQKPENEAYRTSLAPGLAFYRGACLAALGRETEAREEFEIFLAFMPNPSLDPGLYPKKVIALLEDTRRNLKRPQDHQKGKPEQESALAAAYHAYVPPAERREPELGEEWAEGPVRCLLSAEERRSFTRLPDPVSRSEFVTAFWKARDPKPETPENEFRDEFEKRISFADAHFTEGELRGSLTDRGVVFLLLGPPTYVGRKPIGAGEDTAEPTGMSKFTQNDVVEVEKTGGSGAATNVRIDNMTGPGNTILDSGVNWREVWHYRRELLPKDVPYQQVDAEFITRKGYGKNVLQREAAVLNTLEAAKRAVIVDSSARRASN